MAFSSTGGAQLRALSVGRRDVTTWHYRAERLDVSGPKVKFRYFPDHVMAPDISGVFVVDLNSWKFEITESANAEARGLVSTDERCVAALVHKLRSASDPAAEQELFFIA